MKILACDVAKDSVVAYNGSPLPSTKNCKDQIHKLLKQHPDHVVVCEPTGRFHELLVNEAVSLGHRVCVVNPRESHNYKESLSFRAKTDPLDARYLYEYVLRNEDLLRPYKPLTPELKQLRELIGRRHISVECRTALIQSFGRDLDEKQDLVIQALNSLIEDLDKALNKLARSYECYARLMAIPGVGPVSICALIFLLESRSFENDDAMTAFVGLDVRVRQSGKYRGKEKITKRGDPVLRFSLCQAGRGLLNSNYGVPKRKELKSKNRPFAARMVIAARKVIRTAYRLYTAKEEFKPEKWTWALDAKT